MRSVVTVYDMIAEMGFPYTGGAWEPHIRAKRDAIFSARRIMAISEATRVDLLRFYPEVADRVRVIHLGAEHLEEAIENSSGLPAAPRNNSAIFVGHRAGYKNFHAIVDALRSPRWPSHIDVRVVGSPFEPHEQRLIDAYGLTNRIRNLGRLSDSDLRSEYRSAFCFLFPSYLEGFGLPILEAQINGCPVLASNTPVFREVAGEAALFFDPRLGEKLAEAVAAAGEPSIREPLIEAGFENVRRFSWDRTAEQTLAVYREVAESA